MSASTSTSTSSGTNPSNASSSTSPFSSSSHLPTHFLEMAKRLLVSPPISPNETLSEFQNRSELFYQILAELAKINSGDKKDETVQKLASTLQVHVIDPRWFDQPQDVRDRISGVLKNSKLISDPVDFASNPWANETLSQILRGGKPRDANRFLASEPPIVRANRAEVMIRGNLPKLAWNYLKYLIFETTITYEAEGHKEIIMLFVGLALKMKRESDLIAGILNRFSGSIVSLLRELRMKTEEGASESFWVSLIRPNLEEAKNVLINCGNQILVSKGQFPKGSIKEFVANLPTEKLISLGNACDHSEPLYAVAKMLWDRPERDRNKILYLYIKGLSFDLNVIEALKAKKDKEGLMEKEGTLAKIYCEMAEVLHDHEVLNRECLLTAFSLAPTHGTYNQIETLGKKLDQKIKSEHSGDLDMEVDTKPEPMISFDKTIESFETATDGLQESLSKGFSKGLSKLRPNMKLSSENNFAVTRNLKGLLSIEGNILTEAKNYDPLQDPMEAFKLEGFEEYLPDLLVVLNSPRWHMLSWVLNWKVLEERCKYLLNNPKTKQVFAEDLKHLVIDYTVFDDWSSDEETEIITGIEPGYEDWDYSDEED